MKHIKIIPLCIILLLAMAGCRRDLNRDLAPGIKPLDISIQVGYDSADLKFNFPVEKVAVKLVNVFSNKLNIATTDAEGRVAFTNVSAGRYNIEATITIPKDLFNDRTGQSRDEDVVLSGSLTRIDINNKLDSALKLNVHVGRIGGLVLKQIYYAGSNTANGAGFRDQFIEIYNNSNEVIYADSLYVAQLWGTNTTTPNLSTGLYVISGYLTGQFNWNKSIGMPANINATEDYVYAKSLYRIPGHGTQYPIKPGESIVIAQTAVNHKAPYSNNSGGSINIKDPSLTVDLSNADFEVYLAPYLSVPLASDIDNPNVPDMIMLDYSGKDWLLDNPGRDAFAIFKTEDNIPSAYKKYPDPTATSISANTTLYYQIPSNIIIDAVEIQPNVPASRVPKRLVGSLDAGFTFVPAGSYSSQSIIRKTVKVIAGRRVLMDTNNSINDFDYPDRPLPKGFK